MNRYLHSRRKRALDLAVAGALARGQRAGRRPRRARGAARVARPPDLPQRRVGLDGHAFEVYKLRTMVSGAEHMGAGMAVDEGDTRITRIGAFLRRTSIDELPNLVNVLRGEMSLVGPRPTIQVQVDQYTDRQRRRLSVAPGPDRLGAGQRPRVAAVAASGSSSTSGTSSTRRLRLDLRILVLSARMAVTGHGLYRGETGGWR